MTQQVYNVRAHPSHDLGQKPFSCCMSTYPSEEWEENANNL